MGTRITVGLLALIVCTGAPAQVEAQFKSDCIRAPDLRQVCEAEWA